MLTKQNIDTIYRQYRNRPASPYDLNIGLFFLPEMDVHRIAIDDKEEITIGSINPNSPFHKIALKRINAILEFDDLVAIVLHSSIIFLRKNDPTVNIHIKQTKPGLGDRLRSIFGQETE